MKTSAVLILFLVLTVAVQAQEWNYTMHHGDILVYEETNSGDISIIELRGRYSGTQLEIGEAVDSAWIHPHINWIPPFFVGLTGGCIIDMRFQFVDSSGIVFQTGGYEFGDIGLFPLFEPAEDSLLLRSGNWTSRSDTTYAYRRFDTLVCGAPVQAMSFTRKRNDTISYLVVSEIFGFVRINNEHGDWRLSSATIGKVKYNHDTRKFAVFPTCQGSEFLYETSQYGGPDPRNYRTRYLLRDTLIDGVQYFLPGNMLWHNTNSEPYRVRDGIAFVYDGNQEVMLDSAMSLGSRSVNGIIGDTGTVLYEGEMRRYITTVPDYHSYTWIEGIGLITHNFHAQFGGGFTTSLVYANICGIEYGTPVGVGPLLPAVQSSTLLSVYPNPVSQHHGHVIISASQPLLEGTRIAVYDMLGRAVYNQSSSHLRAGEALVVPIGGLSPGMYVCSLSGEGIHDSKILSIVP